VTEENEENLFNCFSTKQRYNLHSWKGKRKTFSISFLSDEMFMFHALKDKLCCLVVAVVVVAILLCCFVLSEGKCDANLEEKFK
jgi:hypothetical protein